MSITYLVAMLHDRIHRARNAPSKGASAVEWVIITATVAVLAFGIAAIVIPAVTNKQQEIGDAFK
ncbi:hypothetical protein Pth03_15990 [Planotetraspora thailandica]|uniref:Uncharacterized protein n=1 Tax=Planotetraspora thailandica TaxID=487172 RepID=A0A8J3XUL0_9ACTN|nr:hypothetical protein [Planotetraspora thailandica]GII53210.1 hypothetical protein Pth03_15990 [Planotetraspora thailandica]